MNLLAFKEDLELQESGTRCCPTGDESSYFLVRRLNTPSYRKEIEDIKRRIYGFSDNINEQELLGYWLAEYGVTGWSGISKEDDSPLPYSKTEARKIFLNPAYQGSNSLNERLIRHGLDHTEYLFLDVKEDIEAAKKS